MGSLKLGVDVVGAHDLMPKDGQGSANAFVELHFDNQRVRTTTKEKDLNPIWDESFYFNISDPQNLSRLSLEAFVFCYNRASNSPKPSCLGKVRLTGTSFVSYAEAVLCHYPLEKRGIFSRTKGELGLKVYVTDDPSKKLSNLLPAVESSVEKNPFLVPIASEHQSTTQKVPNFVASLFSSDKTGSRQTFHHLPNAKQPTLEQQQQQQQQIVPPAVTYGGYGMRPEPMVANTVQAYPGSSFKYNDYSIRETSPYLGGGMVGRGRVALGNRPASSHELVEKMQYLFVRVVKARDLPSKDLTGGLDPYVEVKLGNFKGTTKHFEKNSNPEWNEVFAFTGMTVQSTVLEVTLKDKDTLKDDYVGRLYFDLHEVPTRVPPESPLAAEWYRLEDKSRSKKKGELMLAVWHGTQADEAFPEAWHSDAISPTDGTSIIPAFTRSKVYHSPRLWYVRVNVVEAHDLIVQDKSRFPDPYVKVQIGSQFLRTKTVKTQTMNALWNEDLMFVAAEPFEDHLILSVEDHIGPNKAETLGMAVIPLNSIEKRVDHRTIRSRWYNLMKSMSDAVEAGEANKEKDKEKAKFHSRLHLRICLEGGYHVLDESTHCSSDLRPSWKQLWKPAIGILELGILGADKLHPMKNRNGKGTTDSFCVAKYGQKWVRTRTIIDNLSPKFNEQYHWEVYDPSTVLTVGLFDNGHTGESNSNRDTKIGKIRIRISTLETGRIYTHVYPLLVLHPSGVKKMGELHLALRFLCPSLMNLMLTYSKPLLPKMHYIRPLSVSQQESLRLQAVNIVAARFSRAEPALRKEVVEYMSDANSHLWSMRRSKANFFRIVSVFSGLIAVGKWFGEVCLWKNRITTVLVHLLFLMLVCFPELILPTIFLYMCVIGIWNWRYRPRNPPHMDTKLSYADTVHPDELDEEFDSFPTNRSPDIIRMRYDRMRSIAGKIQSVVGDVATQGERIQALLNWRDPRATAIYIIFCFIAALVVYVTPFQMLSLLTGFYVMRHPRFRNRTPSVPMNFFRRLPARTDSML
ncbi:FT-interacting protein 1-like [Cucurbita moschata]|uniref:FT-interacting protein 1-like n=1 Tax=Cucurbita moschata TaxID=3662 RepID=A0A6J1H3U1_CUCMO|nr:FT-interacting protein 1-like [Cucurbita moschata]